MNNKSHKIVISKPCNEDWDEMHPTESGKFCNSCNKNVIDFSRLSDDEIISFLIANKGKETCGRFYKNQIDTIRIEFPEDIFHTPIYGWKQFLVIFLVCFGFQLFNIEFAIAQSDVSDSLETIVVTDTLGMADYTDDDTLITLAEKQDSTNGIKDSNTLKWTSVVMGDYTMGVTNTMPKEDEETIFKGNQFPNVAIVKKRPRKKIPIKNDAEHKSEMMLVNNNLVNRKRKKGLND